MIKIFCELCSKLSSSNLVYCCCREAEKTEELLPSRIDQLLQAALQLEQQLLKRKQLYKQRLQQLSKTLDKDESN